MTVSNNYAPVVASGDGSTTQFSGYWNALSASYLLVQLLNTTTGVYTTIQQGLASNQYQVTSLNSTGWVITFNTAPAVGYNVVVSRSTTQAQTVPYTTSRGFQGSVEEGSFDLLTNMIQEFAYQFENNTISSSVGDTSANLVLPIVSLRANTYLGFDGEGNVTTLVGGATSPVSTAMAPVVDASSLAVARSALGLASGATSNIPPQGRLTFNSSAPVMTSDYTAQTEIYYVPYNGNSLPVYNGSAFVSESFSSLGLILTTSAQIAGSLYDVFAFMYGGALTIGSGPAWTNLTTRSAAIEQINGIWVNTNAINLTNGGVAYSSFPANEATYLGTFYASANGQSQFNMKPNSSSGGSNSIVGLWNAYNRVPLSSISRDSSGSYSYSTATWRAMNGSTSNRVSVIDGLGQSSISARLTTFAGTATAQASVYIGINQNSTTASPNLIANAISATGSLANNYETMNREEIFAPAIGFNYYQAMENSPNAVTATFNANGIQSLIVEMDY